LDFKIKIAKDFFDYFLSVLKMLAWDYTSWCINMKIKILLWFLMFKIKITCWCKLVNQSYKLERENINHIGHKTPLTFGDHVVEW
jgi:hypothetical protein